MNPKIEYCKKVSSILLEQIPRGHLVAACALTASLLITLALKSEKETVNNLDLNSRTYTSTPQNLINEDTPQSDPIETADTSFDTQTPIVNTITLPSIDGLFKTATVKQAVEVSTKKTEWQEINIASGDNLSTVFLRAGLNDRDIYELFDGNKKAKDLRKITPGQKIAFLVGSDGKLQQLKYVKSNLDSLAFTRNASGFEAEEVSLKPDIKHAFRQGTVNSSLFVAGKQAGLSNSLTMELANIFGFDIDFALDIQKGDSFKVVFEEHFLNGNKIGAGPILTAEFINAGKTYKAVRYTNKEGITRYYSADGQALNKAFLRTPVDFARISSNFSLGRLHPILNTIRAHKGTDYAAATGTPIRATGDGKVIFAGRQGGYGNCIVIRHGQGYETLYGHMNSFAKGISTGSRVAQGQIIGTVGRTGLASGPHLHYEFHVNGQVRNPVTVDLPKAIGIAANEKERFTGATQTLIAQLEDFEKNSRVALGESKTSSN